MSFLAKLEIDGEAYNLINCQHNLNQTIDNNSKSSGMSRGGRLKLTFEVPRSNYFLKWMLLPEEVKDGKVIFYRRDETTHLFDLHFIKAHCLEYQEVFYHNSGKPMQIILKLSAQELHLENARFDRNGTLT